MLGGNDCVTVRNISGRYLAKPELDCGVGGVVYGGGDAPGDGVGAGAARGEQPAGHVQAERLSQVGILEKQPLVRRHRLAVAVEVAQVAATVEDGRVLGGPQLGQLGRLDRQLGPQCSNLGMGTWAEHKPFEATF